jgi:hypothetical protein
VSRTNEFFLYPVSVQGYPGFFSGTAGAREAKEIRNHRTIRAGSEYSCAESGKRENNPKKDMLFSDV